mmetsp:Transcript_42557/g.48906  ORF Transcript_42557/g.48906 Transcript_42557/m.48906 type:complete len:784 (+) Transcript_42557:38-2389(+)
MFPRGVSVSPSKTYATLDTSQSAEKRFLLNQTFDSTPSKHSQVVEGTGGVNFFLNFLTKLKDYPAEYDYFLSQAKKRGIAAKALSHSGRTYDRCYIEPMNRDRLLKFQLQEEFMYVDFEESTEVVNDGPEKKSPKKRHRSSKPSVKLQDADDISSKIQAKALKSRDSSRSHASRRYRKSKADEEKTNKPVTFQIPSLINNTATSAATAGELSLIQEKELKKLHLPNIDFKKRVHQRRSVRQRPVKTPVAVDRHRRSVLLPRDRRGGISTKDHDTSSEDSVDINQSRSLIRKLKTEFDARNNVNKFASLDRDNTKLRDLFKTLGGLQKDEPNFRAARVTRTSLKTHLQNVYGHVMAERMVGVLGLGASFDFMTFCDSVEGFMNSSIERHLKFCFDSYDLNGDDEICMQDIFLALKSVGSTETFSQDYATIFEGLKRFRKAAQIPTTANTTKPAEKKKTKGMTNRMDTLNAHLSDSHRSGSVSTRPRGATEDSNRNQTQNQAQVQVPPELLEKEYRINLKEFCSLAFPQDRPMLFYDFLNTIACVKLGKLARESRPVTPVDLGAFNLETDDFDLEKLKWETLDNYFKPLALHYKRLCSTKRFRQPVVDRVSFDRGFKHVFAMDNPLICKRLFEIIGNGKPEFGQKEFFLFCRDFVRSSSHIKYEVAFKIFDCDGDNLVSGIDVTHLLESLDESCALYQEALILINAFTQSYKSSRNEIKSLTLNTFLTLVPQSVLVEDITQALVSLDPGRRSLALAPRDTTSIIVDDDDDEEEDNSAEQEGKTFN